MARALVPDGRYIFFAAVVLFAFAGICGRLYFLQIWNADEYIAEAEANRRTLIPLDGRRGNIYDRSGNLLAGTRTQIVIGVDPWSVRDSDLEKLPELAGLLGLPLEELEQKATTLYRTNEDGSQGRQIRWLVLGTVDEPVYSVIEGMNLRGVYGNRRYERHYPGNSMAAHVLGYLNKEAVAVMGVERALDFYLRGESGWRETELDGRRRELARFSDREVMPREGLNVELTLDLFVQSIVEDELAQLVETYKPAGASIIVSDPLTGEILGLANYPTFDPNEFWQYPLENQRNRAVTDVYEPGSTFKIVPVAAGLQEGLIRPETVIDCSEPVAEYNGRRIRMPSDHITLGRIPVTQIVAKSSNRGAALIGMMLGDDRMYDYCRSFGFGQPTNWLLAGEVSGTLHPVRAWDGLTISRLPTGYAVSATPLQVHSAMSVIASGGVLLEPRLVKRITDAEGKVVVDFPYKPRNQIISSITAERMAEMLRGVVQEGTARQADLKGYAVAGKTGTSRKIIEGRYTDRHHFASFSGFFPANQPRLVITVVVDDPQLKGSGYGGVVAAPVFKAVGGKLIHHLAIRKPEETSDLIVSR